MSDLVSKLIEEWAVIRGAPRSFIAAAIVVALAAWGITEWHYSGVIDNKDGIISSKDAEISLLTRQRDDYKQASLQNGVLLGIGPLADRPRKPSVSGGYYLAKDADGSSFPIYWTGAAWINATGAVIPEAK